MRLDPLKVQLPSENLTVDIAHITDEEGIILASFTVVGVNIPDMIPQSIFDKFLGVFGAIELDVSVTLGHWLFMVNNWCIVLKGLDGCWCHYLAKGFAEIRINFSPGAVMLC